jgi:hypothetical protein
MYLLYVKAFQAFEWRIKILIAVDHAAIPAPSVAFGRRRGGESATNFLSRDQEE